VTADSKSWQMRHRVMSEWPGRMERSESKKSDKKRSKSCHVWVEEGARPTRRSFRSSSKTRPLPDRKIARLNPSVILSGLIGSNRLQIQDVTVSVLWDARDAVKTTTRLCGVIDQSRLKLKVAPSRYGRVEESPLIVILQLSYTPNP
jgi:hypothetical protein